MRNTLLRRTVRAFLVLAFARCYTDLACSLAASVGADDSAPPTAVAKVDYESLQTGEVRTIQTIDAFDAPEFICFEQHGDGVHSKWESWVPLGPDRKPLIERLAGSVVWKRIPRATPGSIKLGGFNRGNFISRDSGGVRHRGQTLPVSMSLPLDGRPGEVVTEHGQSVVRHRDGTLSTLEGERIIRNSDDARKHAESCGFVRRT